MSDTRQDSHASRSLWAVSACPGAQHLSLLLPQPWGQDRPKWHALVRAPFTGEGGAGTHRGGDGLGRGRSGRSRPVRGLPRAFSPLEWEWTRLQPLLPTFVVNPKPSPFRWWSLHWIPGA